MAGILYIVVPCYNEEEVLHETAKRLNDKLAALISADQINDKSRVVFVDDGSKDRTWDIIEKLHNENVIFTGIKLSHNRGHQNALLSGLLTARNHADMVISMDADLQDDIGVVDQFVAAYYEGNDIVYGVRSSRKTDSFFKRFTATGFYKFMHLLGVEIVYNHADYRLMSKRALDALSEYGEVNLFLRGIVPQMGFKSTSVTYERHERFAGESKYPLKKMLAFAFDGITSFSIRPIRIITILGVIIFAFSLLMIIYFFIINLLGHTIPGWTSTVGSIWMIGGIQLLSLGMIGEYIGKIYNETKHRPRFTIETFLGPDNCPRDEDAIRTDDAANDQN